MSSGGKGNWQAKRAKRSANGHFEAVSKLSRTGFAINLISEVGRKWVAWLFVVPYVITLSRRRSCFFGSEFTHVCNFCFRQSANC